MADSIPSFLVETAPVTVATPPPWPTAPYLLTQMVWPDAVEVDGAKVAWYYVLVLGLN